LALLDEALFEIANLIANLASADGAVILNKHYEILGFGGMISSKMASIQTVARAHDLEGSHFTLEETNNVGTRHRWAYRLAGGLAGSVAIVFSQDGECASSARRMDLLHIGNKTNY
jgi:DNA integrity scanning protein DisA with diadenylate cyclase activity